MAGDRAGRDKDVKLRERRMRETRRLPDVSDGELVLRTSRGHAWLAARAPGPAERHVRLPRWAQVAPGDRVAVDAAGRVAGLVPRRSALRRKAGPKEEVLAANLDQVAIVVGPDKLLREGFLNRALCAVLAEGLTPLLVFQKADVDDHGELRERAELYRQLGFSTFVTSAITGEGTKDLAAALAGRATALLGHSGVGKTSLVNRLFPEARLRTAEVDAWGRGKHATTLARVLVAGDARLIDLPGVRELGLVRLDPPVLDAAFPEVARLEPTCAERGCTHDVEEGCAVQAAVERDEIDPIRVECRAAIVASYAAGTEGGGRL